MLTLVERLRHCLQARYPIIYLHCQEEERLMAALTELLPAAQPGSQLHQWDCVRGLWQEAALADPVAALEAMMKRGPPGLYVFKDLAAHLPELAVQRALRNAYSELLAGSGRTIFITSPLRVIPPGIEKELYYFQVDPPSDPEVLAHAQAVLSHYPKFTSSEHLWEDLSLALRGLTLNEVSHVLHRVCSQGLTDKAAILDEIFDEKSMIVRRTGFLEFVPPRFDINQIGGLENLKDWFNKRQRVFNQEAVAAGIPIPKGILLMGVSGCGKSLCAKVISTLWKVPLYRLDMNLVFSGMYGSAEGAFHLALKTVEAVAPAVLWIDEIENAINMTSSASSSEAHIFSSFLTWMQEKPPLVFIAATANKIDLLPAEVLRKGRFDQVFFVDLPSELERKQILEIHLRRNGADPAEFDLPYLLVATEDWNGAEIEQAVISAKVEAYQEKRPFTTRDVSAAAAKIVPLARTMKEQIKGIRNWAFGRATNASRTVRPIR